MRALFEDAEKDPLGLAGSVREELSYIRSVSSQACEMARMQREVRLPLRVTHNDTKINNVLFDRNINWALTIIDLDTVMLGVVGHIFGDTIGSAAIMWRRTPENTKRLAAAWSWPPGFWMITFWEMCISGQSTRSITWCGPGAS